MWLNVKSRLQMQPYEMVIKKLLEAPVIFDGKAFLLRLGHAFPDISKLTGSGNAAGVNFSFALQHLDNLAGLGAGSYHHLSFDFNFRRDAPSSFCGLTLMVLVRKDRKKATIF